MGPLIPQGFVNPDLNLFFAFVIGLGFGYVLEQAGFSSSRKLAGVFYGYDFVVLRVFFTAAITAMTGLLFFNYLGWIDLSLLYVNPTFLWSAIIGGVIMGFGFILGGFCPGTSLVGAVIGKIDAMFFVIGMFVGIFLFGHFFSLFEPLYLGHNLGSIFVFDSIGISREWFAVILIAVALFAFVVTKKIEDKVNHREEALRGEKASLTIPALVVLGAGFLLLFLPGQPRAKWFEISPETILQEVNEGKHKICPDEAAFGMMNPKNHPLVFVDVRQPDEFDSFTLPGAINIPSGQILENRYDKLFKTTEGKIVLFSYGSTAASEAWMVLRRKGHENVFILDGGLNGLFQSIFFEKGVLESPDCLLIHQTRFREKAGKYFRSGEASSPAENAARPVIKHVEIEMSPQGGC